MPKSKLHLTLQIAGLIFLSFVVAISIVSFPPSKFPVGTHLRVRENTSLTMVSSTLAERHIISSKLLFKIAVALFYGHKSIVAGDYLFDKPQNMWTIARRLSHGEQGILPIKVTIPEGATVNDIGFILLKRIPDFDAPYFEKIAHNSEGYLFPDTYSFYPDVSADEVFSTMRDEFDKKLQGLNFDMTLIKRNSHDVVIMASILEKEATSSEDRALIAGILWKRLDEGMPLQVDVAKDTYEHRGLPAAAIANPGLDALKATVHPLKTAYYYYLSDKNSVIHYAKTYEEHLKNKRKYLQ